jgi:carboxymethylenebutenolidase
MSDSLTGFMSPASPASYVGPASDSPVPDLGLGQAWDEHLGAEFGARDAAATIATMTATPRVNHIPVMTGGHGKVELHAFYARFFIPELPPDLVITPISRTIGQGRVVDELNVKFTHTVPMIWMLPGVPPTHKVVEVALVVIAQFDGRKLAHEHLYWDQASVLVQLGLLDAETLPVVGVEGPRSVRDLSLPLNELIRRAGGDL